MGADRTCPQCGQPAEFTFCGKVCEASYRAAHPTGEPAKKIDTLRALMQTDMKAALRYAAKFPQLGDERAPITRGAEATTKAEFYRQLGKDPKELVRAGIAALKRRYG